MTHLSETERMEIKAATREAMRLAGGVERFAGVARVAKAALSKYGSVSELDSYVRADVILEHAREIGAPMLLEALAGMVGYRLVPIEGSDDPEAVGVSDLLAVTRNDVAHSLGDALSDGVVDIHERRAVREKIAIERAVLSRLDRKLARSAS